MRLSVPDMSCGHCKAAVERAIAEKDATASVTVDLSASGCGRDGARGCRRDRHPCRRGVPRRGAELRPLQGGSGLIILPRQKAGAARAVPGGME